MRLMRIIDKAISFILLHILQLRVSKTVEINGIKLCINPIDRGGRTYITGHPYKEAIDPLYKLIKKEFNPSLVLDIGANYGFISMICAKYFPGAWIIAIEPDKRLCRYIKKSSTANLQYVEVINAICDKEAGIEKSISLNPVNSMDNRVKPPFRLWREKQVETVSIDYLVSLMDPIKTVFIKTDTQGYEGHVIRGGEKFLTTNKNWLMKAEFAPQLLLQHGTDPVEFLKYLINRYDVVDYHGTSHNEAGINDLFLGKITDAYRFIEYVTKRNHSDLGWIDLLIRPKSDYDPKRYHALEFIHYIITTYFSELGDDEWVWVEKAYKNWKNDHNSERSKSPLRTRGG